MGNTPNGRRPELRAVTEQPQQQQVVPGMNLGYAPLHSVVGEQELPDGTKVIALRLESVVGMNIFLLDAPHAKALAHQLDAAASRIASGLTVAKTLPPELPQ